MTSLAKNSLVAIGCLLLACALPLPTHAELTRHDFAAAMATLTPGLPSDQVVALLGQPDDIRTPYDPGGIQTSRTTEIWAYGTDAHLSFPTLGSVYLDHGKVQYVNGGRGMPPAPALFDEADLPQRTTLQAEFVYAGKTTLSPIFNP